MFGFSKQQTNNATHEGVGYVRFFNNWFGSTHFGSEDGKPIGVVAKFHKEQNTDPTKIDRIVIDRFYDLSINPTSSSMTLVEAGIRYCDLNSVREHFVMPCGTFLTSDAREAFRNLLASCYFGEHAGHLGTPEITMTFLFSFMQFGLIECCNCFKQRSQTFETNQNTHERLFMAMRNCFELIRTFAYSDPACGNLVEALAGSTEALDVLQREVAMFILRKPMTPNEMESMMKVAMRRSLMHRMKEFGKYTTPTLEQSDLYGIMSLFVVCPAVALSKNASELRNMIHDCCLMLESVKFKEALRMNDEKFEGSGHAYHMLAHFMNHRIGIPLNVPPPNFFIGKYNEVLATVASHKQVTLPTLKLPPSVEECTIVVAQPTGKPPIKTCQCNVGQDLRIRPNNLAYYTALKVKQPITVSVDFEGTTEQAVGDIRSYPRNAPNIVIGKLTSTSSLCYNEGGSYSPLTGQLFTSVRSGRGYYSEIAHLTEKKFKIVFGVNENAGKVQIRQVCKFGGADKVLCDLPFADLFIAFKFCSLSFV